MTKRIVVVLTVLVATTAHAAVIDLGQAVIPTCYAAGAEPATCASDSSSATVSLVVLPEYDALAGANETVAVVSLRVLADNGQQLYFGLPRPRRLESGPTRITLRIPRRVLMKIDAYRQEWVQVNVYVTGQDLGAGKDRLSGTQVADSATVWLLFNPEKPVLPPPPPPPKLPTCTLAAVPATIHVGETARLSWTSRNATALSLRGVGAVASDGVTDVEPHATTAYILSATSAAGTTTCKVVVKVVP